MHKQSLNRTISYAKALLREICPPRKGYRGGRGLRRLDQPNFSLASACLFLGACCWACLAQAAGLGQITAAMNGSASASLPFPFPAAGMIDSVRRDWTARRIAGCSRFCACHVCLGCGLWMARPRARFGGCCVGLAQVEANPQRLLRYLSHSPFLPTFFHFAVCLVTVQIVAASTSPFSPSPAPLNCLISDISDTLDNLPTSNTPSAPACKQ